MSERVRPTAIFWVVAVLALLWFLMGSFAYVSSHYYTADLLIPIYGEEGTAILMDRPVWQTAAWAFAVIGGLMGSLVMILRKAWSRILFVISLIGAIVYDIWVFTSGYFEHSLGFDKFIFVMAVLAPLILIWFTSQMISKGVLR